MRLLQKLLPFLLVAAASPLDARHDQCVDTACAKSLQKHAKKGYNVDGDCSSYQRATVTPCTVTTTKTVHTACPTATVTKGQSSKRTEEFADFEARNASPTCGSIQKPSQIPGYAEPVCRASDYQSACSCLGHYSTTVTKATSTVTTTTTKCSGTPTVTVTISSTGTSTSHSTSSSSTTSSFCGASPTAVACGTSQNYPGRVCKTTCGADRPGGDYSNAYKGSLQACIDTCAADPRCVSVSYHDGNGYCYYKSSANALTSACNMDVVDCSCVTTVTVGSTMTQTAVVTSTVATSTTTDTNVAPTTATETDTTIVSVPTSATLITTDVTVTAAPTTVFTTTTVLTSTTEVDTSIITSILTTTVAGGGPAKRAVAIDRDDARAPALVPRNSQSTSCSTTTITTSATTTVTSTSKVTATATTTVHVVSVQSVTATVPNTKTFTVTLTETDISTLSPTSSVTDIVTSIVTATLVTLTTTTSTDAVQATCTTYDLAVASGNGAYLGSFVDGSSMSVVVGDATPYPISLRSSGRVYGGDNTLRWLTNKDMISNVVELTDGQADASGISDILCSVVPGVVTGVPSAAGLLSCTVSGRAIIYYTCGGSGGNLFQDHSDVNHSGSGCTALTLAATFVGFC